MLAFELDTATFDPYLCGSLKNPNDLNEVSVDINPFSDASTSPILIEIKTFDAPISFAGLNPCPYVGGNIALAVAFTPGP